MVFTGITSQDMSAVRESSAEAAQAASHEYNWREEPVGLYLHIPFCQSKCIYCDFNSYAGLEGRYEPFVRALCADLLRGASRFLPGEPDCAGQRISTRRGRGTNCRPASR